MKILKSCGSPSWGGIEIYVLRTILELREMGHDTSILCLENSEISKHAEKNKIPYIPILKKGARRPGEFLKLRKYFEASSFDIIHTHLSNDLWSLVPALNTSGNKTPLVLSKCMASGINKKDIFHRYLYKRVNRITAVSRFIEKNVLETCPVKPENVIVINDAISPAKWDPEKYDKKTSKSGFGFHGHDIVIGMIGRISPGKGHDVFFRSVKQILDSGITDNVKFMVVGTSSPEEKEFEAKVMGIAAKLGVSDKILFTGYTDDIPLHLSAMDILAFPSNEESFGGTLLEAMAMKVPVAAFESGGVPDIVINGTTGFLTRRNNVEEFTDSLLKLIKDKDLRERIAEAGRIRVEHHFDLRQNMNRFVELYKSLMKQNFS